MLPICRTSLALLLLTLAGCGSFGQRPTEPFTADTSVSRTVVEEIPIAAWLALYDRAAEEAIDGIVRRTTTESASATITGDENAKGKSSVEISPSGVTFNTPGSNALEWASVNPAGLFWIGAAFLAVGLGLLYISSNPIGAFTVPRWFALAVMGCGGAVMLLPYVGESLRLPIMLGGIAAVVIAGFYAAIKLGWFNKATDEDAQRDRLAKGDTGGAAALAYLNTRNKDKAREIKGAAPVRDGASGQGGPKP